VRFLSDYFQRRQIIPKFYFIVDSLDLLIQAQRKFTSCGLTVYTSGSCEAFSQDIKFTQVIHNHFGKPEITMVNIKKFKDNADVVSTKDYDIAISAFTFWMKCIPHSYNPKGSFLANLNQSDPNATKTRLTDTPLLGDNYNSRTLFGNYTSTTIMRLLPMVTPCG
jgi:type I restriction enzyme R subunit